jgi:hypothetical protein
LPFLLFALCCQKDEAPAPIALRTVIAYMVADNDLSGCAMDDIAEMRLGVANGQAANLLVYVDAAEAAPCLLRIARGVCDTLRRYEECNSCSPDQLRRVLSEAAELYPAEDYGLVLWSHGTSWLPTGALLRSFGLDGEQRLNIPDLAAALPLHFEFVLLDACGMGAVEVAYELRHAARYFIASSTDILEMGFPYDLILPKLLAATPDLRGAAEGYMEYYRQQQGDFRSATVALLATAELENLAAATRRVVAQQPFSLATFDRASVQRLDMFSEQYAFDFLDFISQAFPHADTGELTAQLSRVVLYKAHTASFLEQYPVDAYCGLSTYIPHPQRSDLNSYYRRLAWYGDSGYSTFF